jgi:hypothetical protein
MNHSRLMCAMTLMKFAAVAPGDRGRAVHPRRPVVGADAIGPVAHDEIVVRPGAEHGVLPAPVRHAGQDGRPDRAPGEVTL